MCTAPIVQAKTKISQKLCTRSPARPVLCEIITNSVHYKSAHSFCESRTVNFKHNTMSPPVPGFVCWWLRHLAGQSWPPPLRMPAWWKWKRMRTQLNTTGTSFNWASISVRKSGVFFFYEVVQNAWSSITSSFFFLFNGKTERLQIAGRFAFEAYDQRIWQQEWEVQGRRLGRKTSRKCQSVFVFFISFQNNQSEIDFLDFWTWSIPASCKIVEFS